LMAFQPEITVFPTRPVPAHFESLCSLGFPVCKIVYFILSLYYSWRSPLAVMAWVMVCFALCMVFCRVSRSRYFRLGVERCLYFGDGVLPHFLRPALLFLAIA